MAMPPGGAAALRTTVPVDVLPLATLVGFSHTDTRLVAGTTVRAADLPMNSAA
jgi:hypothetical protein